jgi:hypothetical protein
MKRVVILLNRFANASFGVAIGQKTDGYALKLCLAKALRIPGVFVLPIRI